jgi:hypothetical protein
VLGHRVRECPRKPSESDIRTALHSARAKAAERALNEFKQLKADKAANRAGRLSGGQHHRMEQAMAYFSQLQTTADRDLSDAAGHDWQLFAPLSHLASADLMDARQALYEEALGDDGREEMDGIP